VTGTEPKPIPISEMGLLCRNNTTINGHVKTNKVDDFGSNRKRVCDFLLVGHCDYGPIFHRIPFPATATYWLKIAYFSHLTLIRRHRSHTFPLKFRISRWR